MKCYYHQDRDAVAICKYCGKGLCPECATEVGKGIACKSTCVAEVKAMNAVLHQSMKGFETNRRVYAQLAIWMTVIGIGSFVSSFYLTAIAGLQIFTGIVMILGAVYMYSASRRYRVDKNP